MGVGEGRRGLGREEEMSVKKGGEVGRRRDVLGG